MWNRDAEWRADRNLFKDEVLSHQKPFSDTIGLGYTSESSSNVKVTKDMKFVKAKEPIMVTSAAEKVKEEKNKKVTDQRVLNKSCNQSVVRPEAKGKSLPKAEKGPRKNHFCHHYGIQGHTRPNCHKLQTMKNLGA